MEHGRPRGQQRRHTGEPEQSPAAQGAEQAGGRVGDPGSREALQHQQALGEFSAPSGLHSSSSSSAKFSSSTAYERSPSSSFL